MRFVFLLFQRNEIDLIYILVVRPEAPGCRIYDVAWYSPDDEVPQKSPKTHAVLDRQLVRLESLFLEDYDRLQGSSTNADLARRFAPNCTVVDDLGSGRASSERNVLLATVDNRPTSTEHQ